MTDKQKNQIAKYREEGYGYNQISKMMDLSLESIKTYCRRHGLNGVAAERRASGEHACLNCSITIIQNPSRKEKKFCSDRWRIR